MPVVAQTCEEVVAAPSVSHRLAVREAAAVVAIALGLLAALAWQAWNLGVTIDEPSHLLSSYLYWHGRDRLMPRDMPPLIKIVGGAPIRNASLPIPADLGKRGDTRDEWTSALTMMEKLPAHEVTRIFFAGRMALLVFPLGCALLIWYWGRELFNPLTGVLLMLAFALEPTAMGHGSLFKNDLAATFGYLVFWYCAWRYWRRPSTAGAALLGAALLLAVLSKLSMLFLVPVAPVIVAACRLSLRPRPPLGVLRDAAAVLLVTYFGVLAAYQFDTHRIRTPDFYAQTAASHLSAPFVAGAQIFRVIPAAAGMWEGSMSLFANNSDTAPVYLFHKIYPHGNRLYFAEALAVKAPLALQCLFVVAILCALVSLQRKRPAAGAIFWLLPGLLYITLASLSALQLGVRLILPALPFGLLLCGFALVWMQQRRLTVAVAALLFLRMGWQAAAVYPNGIAFFNYWAGGPRNGLQYLADSNLDWGQSLPQLAAFVFRNHIPKMHLAYFGTDNPYRFFTDDNIEPLYPPWNESITPNPRYRPQPGYYAISATLLPGQYFPPKYRDYFAAFRNAQPVARVGYSIYLYKF